MVNDALKQIWEKVDKMAGPHRLETEAEHIARDMREGRFPERSDRIQVPVDPHPMTHDTTPPNRIWVRWPQPSGTGLAFSCQSRPPELRTEYNLASDVAAIVAAALREAVEACEKPVIEDASYAFDYPMNVRREPRLGEVKARIEALIPQPAVTALDRLIAEAVARGRINGLTEAELIASTWSIEAAEAMRAAKGESK